MWHTLKAPQGLLGGIGRRVSTLIWGGAAAAGGAGGGIGEAKLVQVVTAANDSDGESSVFVLTASHLQRWAICDGGADQYPSAERLVFNCDLETMAKEAFASPEAGLWGGGSNNPTWLRLWTLDMKLYSSKGVLAVLIAAVNPQTASNAVHYAIATVSTRGECAPTKFASFNVLGHTRELPPSTLASAEAESAESAESSAAIAAVTNYRLVLPCGSRTAYVYSEDSIMCAPVVSGDGNAAAAPVDIIDLNPSTGGGNEILGAGSDCNATMRPIFFTALYGLVNVIPVGGVESANQVGENSTTICSYKIIMSIMSNIL